MSRSTCIPLYPATDGQQTGNNFVDGNKQHVDGNMLPWCINAVLMLLKRCDTKAVVYRNLDCTFQYKKVSQVRISLLFILLYLF